MIKEGEQIPAVTLRHMTPDGPVALTTSDLCKDKKVVIFGVPGAYTPTCSLQHLPSYVEHAEEIFAKGVDDIACVAVNDVFVMDAWGRENQAANKVKMLSDGNADFAAACGLEMDGSGFGMGARLQRFAMVLDNGRVTLLHVEKPGAYEVSSAEAVLAALQD